MARVREPDKRRVAVNVSLDLALLTRLDAAAERAGASRSELLRRLLTEALVSHGAEDEDWRFSDRRQLLADYAPEDEGLYDNPEALGATRVSP